jgi:gamma-glutamylputrescine oxidase
MQGYNRDPVCPLSVDFIVAFGYFLTQRRNKEKHKDQFLICSLYPSCPLWFAFLIIFITRNETPFMTFFDKSLLTAAKVASLAWAVAPVIFPEKLEIDDNQSLWATYTPDYKAGEPLKQDISVDLAIIGGGFTGTSTAYHFSQRYPEKRVALFEAKTLANGASGRNGGMMLNWVTDQRQFATDEMTQRVYNATHEGIKTILGMIDRHHLDVSLRHDGSLEVYTNAQRAESAHRAAEHHQSLGIPVCYLDGAELKKHIGLQGAHGAVLDPHAGQINGLQLVRGLRPVLVEQGVEIYEQTPILKIREGREIELTTPHATVKAKAIVLATNGYTGKLGYFRDAVFPLHSHVFATEPLTKEQQQSIGWHQSSGYADDYDRISYSVITNEGNLVFGGGSNASYAYLFNNRTAYPGIPEKSMPSFHKMENTLHDYLPNSKGFAVKHRWSGTLGITLKRNNLMGVRGEHRNVFYAIGYCGHGVTLANLSGKVITDMYSGDDERWRGLPFYHATYAPIPPEPFRWLGYQFFTRVTGKSPRVSSKLD